MGRRIGWLGLVLMACFVVVLVQLVNVQVRQASSLNAAATNPRNAARRDDNDRGIIRAADGTVLARSVKISDAGPGEYRYVRTYPTGPLFSSIVGYWSRVYGTQGVEYEYDAALTPHEQAPQTLGQVLSPPGPRPDDVTLTVQPRLQRVLKTALGALPGPDRDAAAVVLQPRSGAVLAMYSNPTFDPNTLASPDATKEELARAADETADAEGFAPLYPLATWYPVLPGSTFKVVTSAAAYNLKPTLAGFTYPESGCTTRGQIPTTTNVICNDADTTDDAERCGGTMARMLPQSCDPGYAVLGLHIGAADLSKQAKLFGYNQRPPIDLTSSIVQTSVFPSVDKLQPGQSPGPGGVAYAAFGQGTVSATALQGAMVTAGIADTGTVMRPHVMAQIRDAQGDVVRRYTPTVYRQATSAGAARSVNRLMQGVVSTPHGTAHGLLPAADRAAVKTGTAQVGTSSTRTDDWMIGFAPYTSPTVAVAVLVPYQSTTGSGATVAGPVFKEIIEAALAEQGANAPTATARSRRSR
ncbi:MAG TPA: penicillin-binding transpeptidase domain-containing protein [Acidimicrobiales bacterium]|nr:penicillin-binding transpeptidase domain-containing protein [Acidimicrobiales bacterium]